MTKCEYCFEESDDLKDCFDCYEPICNDCRYTVEMTDDHSIRNICQGCIDNYEPYNEEVK